MSTQTYVPVMVALVMALILFSHLFPIYTYHANHPPIHTLLTSLAILGLKNRVLIVIASLDRIQTTTTVLTTMWQQVLKTD